MPTSNSDPSFQYRTVRSGYAHPSIREYTNLARTNPEGRYQILLQRLQRPATSIARPVVTLFAPSSCLANNTAKKNDRIRCFAPIVPSVNSIYSTALGKKRPIPTASGNYIVVKGESQLIFQKTPGKVYVCSYT